MKSIFTTFLLLLIPFYAFTQARSYLGFSLGLDYSYRLLSQTETFGIYEGPIRERNRQESAILNPRLGVHYSKRLGKRFFLKAGLNLSSMGYKGSLTENSFNWEEAFSLWGNELNATLFTPDILYIQEYMLLEVSVAGRMEIPGNNLIHVIELGVQPSYLIQSRMLIYSDRGLDTYVGSLSPQTPREIQTSIMPSYGLVWPKKGPIQLFGQVFVKSLLQVIAPTPIQERLIGTGLELGIRREI